MKKLLCLALLPMIAQAEIANPELALNARQFAIIGDTCANNTDSNNLEQIQNCGVANHEERLEEIEDKSISITNGVCSALAENGNLIEWGCAQTWPDTDPAQIIALNFEPDDLVITSALPELVLTFDMDMSSANVTGYYTVIIGVLLDDEGEPGDLDLVISGDTITFPMPDAQHTISRYIFYITVEAPNGVASDLEYYGSLPTGDGVEGGTFEVTLTVVVQ